MSVQQRVGILMYHAVIRTPLDVDNWCFLAEELFQRQIAQIKTHFEVIPLSSVVQRLAEGSIRRPTVALTFDDGFQNNYDLAFPILRDAGLPATIFLATGLVGTDSTLWFCRLNRAIANATLDRLSWRGIEFDLSTPEARSASGHSLERHVKTLPHPELCAEVRAISVTLGDDPDGPMTEASPYRMLDQDAIAAMGMSGLVDFGGHTHSHAILNLLSPTDQREEIVRSLRATERLTGRACSLFAYPNGRREDYDAHCIDVLQQNQVRTAVTAIEVVNDARTPPLELTRSGIGGTAAQGEFEAFVADLLSTE